MMRGILLIFCAVSTLVCLIPLRGLMAQDMAETRRWIGFGHSYGDYGENDLDTTYSVKGLANEIMMTHQMNEDGTTFGQALMDTRFETASKTQMVTITTLILEFFTVISH